MNTENHYSETDLGNISIHLCGEYDPQRAYEYLDAVEFGGGSYICAIEYGKTITGIAPEPTKNTEYWHINSIPGTLTPEYIAMHDRVVNLSEQVEADAEEVRTAEQNVSGMELNVTQMQEQTRQSAEAAEQSKDSAAGYAASADASRQAAEESEQNINAQVTGFDAHVAEKTSEAENDIEVARIAANKAIIAQQEQSVNEVTRTGIESISTAQAAAQIATEKAQAAATSEKNAAASEAAAKLSEENATKMAGQVATDKEQIAHDRTAVENAKQEMAGSVAQIEQNTQRISELKSDIDKNFVMKSIDFIPYKFINYDGNYANSGYSSIICAIASVEPNEVLKIEFGTNENLPYKYLFLNENGEKIQAIPSTVATATTISEIIKAPENAYFIIISAYLYNDVDIKIGRINKERTLIENFIPQYLDYWTHGYVWNELKQTQPVPDYGFYKIPCGKGDIFEITTKSTQYIGCFFLYDENFNEIIRYGNTAKENAEYSINKYRVVIPKDNCILIVNTTTENAKYIKRVSKDTKKVVIVDSNGFGDFTTFRGATEYCRNHHNTHVIVRTPCNLLNEYDDVYLNNIPSSYDRNHSIGPECGYNCTYTFIHGAKLIFNYTRNNPLVAEMFSPINIVGSCTFENMEIECSNCRYCVHEDIPTVLSIVPWYCNVKYINCKMTHNGNTIGTYRNTACIGAGSSPYSTSIIENGVYKAINGIASITYHLPSMHSNTNSKVIIKNIYADGKVQTSDFGGGDNGKLEVEVSGCSLSENLYFDTKTKYTEWNNIVRS